MDHFSDKLRILLLGPVPPPMGGIARYCQDIISSNLAQEFEITFFPITIPCELRPKAYTHERRWNFFARDGFLNGVRQISFVCQRMVQYDKLLREQQFDMLHVISCTGWGFWRNAVHVYLARQHRVKVLSHVVGAIDEFWRHGTVLRRYLIRHSLDMADVLVVQSEGLLKITSEFTRKPVVAIYNGIRPQDFTPADGYSHSDISEGRIRVVTLGVLGHRKGYYDLIEVANRLRKDITGLEFVFIGGGEVELFRKLVANKELSSMIRVTGQINDNERATLLKSSDIFALPTYSEGQPIAVLEAMAAGLPIISTPVGSIGEVVKESNGILITPGNLDALAKAIQILARSPELRKQMGILNAHEASKKYSLERVMREFGKRYRDCCGD